MSSDFLWRCFAPPISMMPTLAVISDHYVLELIKKHQLTTRVAGRHVAMATMPSTYLYLTEQLPDVEFVNATDMVD